MLTGSSLRRSNATTTPRTRLNRSAHRANFPLPPPVLTTNLPQQSSTAAARSQSLEVLQRNQAQLVGNSQAMPPTLVPPPIITSSGSPSLQDTQNEDGETKAVSQLAMGLPNLHISGSQHQQQQQQQSVPPSVSIARQKQPPGMRLMPPRLTINTNAASIYSTNDQGSNSSGSNCQSPTASGSGNNNTGLGNNNKSGTSDQAAADTTLPRSLTPDVARFLTNGSQYSGGRGDAGHTSLNVDTSISINSEADAAGDETRLPATNTTINAAATTTTAKLSINIKSSASLSSMNSNQGQGEVPAAVAVASDRGSADEYVLCPENIEVIERIGEGAVGIVHKVKYKPTGKTMARKSVAVYPDENTHRQLVRELSFLKQCKSKYIVAFYGAYYSEDDSGPSIYMCMEFCSGGSLDAISKRIGKIGGRIGENVLGRIAEAVLGGLVYLHQCNIIHRDVKPSNILVTGRGKIKLCDFGVSGELVDSIAQTFVGTSYYMAMTVIELLDYIVRMPVPTLPESEWTPVCIDFIEQCLIKDPNQRPTPSMLLSHEFVRRSLSRNLNLKAWINSVWKE
ncbi:Protein kinase C signaling pathway involved MAPKK protein [Spiromyces aspiralis]|uniref:Protein kinase C signaling pathway involved MAPKK protein n=1 Tax=Spiromyces aspiralis TaxID=68401 RepID=A0ACC1HGL2_9FUNG|nr:Protein kinase C signaling pathway involved MAPKK protein [Spiromyces aspiralis]